MKRTIFLVDMNAFFISCEMARNDSLKGKPAAVAGDPKNRSGIILTANYDARKFGVKTTMIVSEARKLCPNIILVPPDHAYYEEKSHEVMEILRSFSPVIEQNSIDEAWMDLTGCEALFGSPLKIAERIMNNLLEELNLWCSIGISYNKFLAKMASERRKPLGITEIWEKDIENVLWPLGVREMYGIGKQTENKLKKFGIYTIGDIAKCDVSLLTKTFGRYGEELYKLSNGIDISKVDSNPQSENKSISRSTTLAEDIADIETAKSIILRLSEEVGQDARRCNLKGKTVSIVIKYGDFQSITRQKSVNPTYLTRDIYMTGTKLLEENWNKRGVRLLGIGLSNFKDSECGQLSFFSGSSETMETDKEEKLEKAMDAIRQKFGHDKIIRAKTITQHNK